MGYWMKDDQRVLLGGFDEVEEGPGREPTIGVVIVF